MTIEADRLLTVLHIIEVNWEKSLVFISVYRQLLNYYVFLVRILINEESEPAKWINYGFFGRNIDQLKIAFSLVICASDEPPELIWLLRSIVIARPNRHGSAVIVESTIVALCLRIANTQVELNFWIDKLQRIQSVIMVFSVKNYDIFFLVKATIIIRHIRVNKDWSEL